MNNRQFTAMVGETPIIVETGRLAGQASGAVTVRAGGTMLLATATMSKYPREGADFLPLTVDFEERLYAAGRIPGSFFRREGRPPESAILIARLTDRPLRPLFPQGMRHEVQIILTALSHDQIHNIDILGIVGASTVLTISDIPWAGPVGAVRVGLLDGQLVVNPTIPQMEQSQLNLRMAGMADAVLMVEANACEVPEEIMLEAIRFGHEALKPLITLQNEMREALGKPKRELLLHMVANELEKAVVERVGDRLRQVVREATGLDKEGYAQAIEELRTQIVNRFLEQDEEVPPEDVRKVFERLLKAAVRRQILEQGVRPDGRGPKDLRPITCEVGLSPRAHGSGLFTRGETQVLTIATLGTPREEQPLDGLYPEDSKRYIHHYNFPPYSTGEVWSLRGPQRREIGHGALAEAALRPMIPSEDGFPYTIRLVSEVLSSNGSTSMASVCASTLSLMDTGVPIKAPVAGVAMGLIKEGDDYAILTDILGMEDHLGDMDFKVAGTRQGLTALQMDIKIKGLGFDILAQALAQAREARLYILDRMQETIAAPRLELSPYAPRMTIMHVDPDKLGAVIGPGGKMVRSIQEECNVRVDIEDDGTIYIASVDGPGAAKAQEIIERLTEEPEVGKIYTGKVVRITDFGAFVEIMPGTDGMVHISQLADYHAASVRDVMQIGDEILVMVTDIDREGKIRLSRRAVLEGWTPEQARQYDRPGGGRVVRHPPRRR